MLLLMRAGKVYTCPQCGEVFQHPVTCFRCELVPRDEFGNPPPPLFERETLLRGTSTSDRQTDSYETLESLADIGGYPFNALARQAREFRRVRRLRNRLESLPLTPIAAATGPFARVTGRIELIQPPEEAGDSEIAFLLRRRRETGGNVTIETRSACGRFLLRDDSGVMLVDDDFVAILPPPGNRLPASRSHTIEGHHRDWAEAAGPVEMCAASAFSVAEHRGGLREAPTILRFQGTASDLVIVRPIPAPVR